MNSFVNAVKGVKTTENGAKAYSTTNSKVYDMFALGGAYRCRSVEDCISLFENAYSEDSMLALKCLAYLRDCREGQGERRFGRECLTWLAENHPDVVNLNIKLIPEFGRWDDLYALVNTKCWDKAVKLIMFQLNEDMSCKTPSLLAKWLASENASSERTKTLGAITRSSLGLTPREYRKTLSTLRERIRVVERLMSLNRWDEIEFDKIPSKAGLIYRNAFAHNDITKERYAQFAMSKTTKVNAKTLYPYEIVSKARHAWEPTEIAMLDKYWENLPTYDIDNTLVIADVSGSMSWGCGSVMPIDVSIAMAMYFADKQKGDFKNLFMTFSSDPEFVEVTGSNISEKVRNINNADWGGSTNLVAAFELILETAIKNHVPQSDMPKNVMVVSDMEIDRGADFFEMSEMEGVHKAFEDAGYEVPNIIYWNVNARNDTILDRSDGVTCVSGCSPVIFEQVMNGTTGYELMLDKITSERYSAIRLPFSFE